MNQLKQIIRALFSAFQVQQMSFHDLTPINHFNKINKPIVWCQDRQNQNQRIKATKFEIKKSSLNC